jgi:nicotinamide phosphoribosyltransferase
VTQTNICLSTDSYKATHWPQYPPGTTKVYSYLESRGGRWPETVFYGLQGILKDYLVGENRVTPDQVHDADVLLRSHFGREGLFNREGWMHICRDHSGRLPVSIKALPEGTVVPIHNALITIENTCPRCYWLTNYLETLLVQVWYPITVATQSREVKRIIKSFLKKTSDSLDGLDFKLHDFGFRGVSSSESAAIGGAAHLVNFKGTDTLAALTYLARYYGEPCAGYSIPASEHSTITSWGRENEVGAYRNMLDKYPTGLVACVSDSFDINSACSELWGGALRDQVLSRDGVLVVRPDSGKPVEIVLEVVRRLGEAFGYNVNNKGYKVLNPKVRVIQGDGVNIDSIAEILRTLSQFDWSAENVAFGMGGALLQKLDRDTQKMAFKCSYIEGQAEYGTGNWQSWSRDVFKQPITDPGKNSQRGRLKVVRKNTGFYTQPEALSNGDQDHLVEVFKNGDLLVDYNLASIRERAAI